MRLLRSRTMVRLSFDLQRNVDEWSLVLLVEVHGLVSVLAFALAVEMQRPSASSCVPYVNSGEDSIAPVLSVQELDESTSRERVRPCASRRVLSFLRSVKRQGADNVL